MKLLWFFSSLIGSLSLASGMTLAGWVTPAQAGELSTWHFDANQNRLDFTTNADVQPRAQLVFDPTRLVIDLPGLDLGEEAISQPIGGAIQQIRIGQFDAETTRIVIELSPGYTIDPQQVKFRGLSPTQWTVQLPPPQLLSETPALPNAVTSTTANTAPRTATFQTATPPTAAPQTSPPPVSASPQAAPASLAETLQSAPASSLRPEAATTASARTVARSRTNSSTSVTEVTELQVTREGLLLKTDGRQPQVEIERSGRREITIRLDNARLNRDFGDRDRSVNRHQVDDLEVDQSNGDVEITLDVDRRSPDWEAQVNAQGQVLLQPKSEEVAADPEPPAARAARPAVPATRSNLPAPRTSGNPVAATAATSAVPNMQLATVQGIELDLSGNQLLIQTDRPVAHRTEWQSGLYVITLSPAQLADQVKGPQLRPADPLRRVRLRQADDQTVVITVQPASGVQFGSLNLITPQMLALDMQRPSNTASRSAPNGSGAFSLPNLLPNQRLVVVLDPGHGGIDPGAVGIGDIQEADLVLPIAQQVATLLERQGIQTVLTRTSDVDVDLEPRVQMAEQVQADLFVSIHANSVGMDRPEVNGAETYYYSTGEALATTIQNSIVTNLNMNDRGVRQARFYVLRRTSMPSVLVETGFVTGSEDAPRLADPNFRSQMAVAIARGILQYIQQQAMAGNRPSSSSQ